MDLLHDIVLVESLHCACGSATINHVDLERKAVFCSRICTSKTPSINDSGHVALVELENGHIIALVGRASSQRRGKIGRGSRRTQRPSQRKPTEKSKKEAEQKKKEAEKKKKEAEKKKKEAEKKKEELKRKGQQKAEEAKRKAEEAKRKAQATIPSKPSVPPVQPPPVQPPPVQPPPVQPLPAPRRESPVQPEETMEEEDMEEQENEEETMEETEESVVEFAYNNNLVGLPLPTVFRIMPWSEMKIACTHVENFLLTLE